LQPGKYAVRLGYQNEDEKHGWVAKVETEPVAFEVVRPAAPAK
jgi:hypothetical protein